MGKGQSSFIWILLILILLSRSSPDKPTPVDNPATPNKPSQRLIDLLSKIRKLAKANPEVAKKIAPFYQASFRIAMRPEVETAQELLDALEQAIKIKGGLNPELALPGMSDARNSLLKQAIGNRNSTLKDDERQELTEILKGIAWALENPE